VEPLAQPARDRLALDPASEDEHAADVHVHRTALGLDRRDVGGE
jgi:hypothetical protein